MSQQLGEQVLNHVDGWMNGLGHVIQELAKSLGVAAEHVYTVYTKQVFAEGLVDIITCSVGLLFLLTYWGVYFMKIIPNRNKNDYYEGWMVFGGIGGGFISLFILLGISVMLPDALLHMINPEYYTIQKLVDMVHSISK